MDQNTERFPYCYKGAHYPPEVEERDGEQVCPEHGCVVEWHPMHQTV